MFAWWGRTVVRGRWWVIAAGVALALVGGLWGTGVFGVVSGGGFNDPHSESARAAERIVAELGRQDVDVLVLYSSADRTADEASFRDAVTGTLNALRQRPEVSQVVSYYDTASPALVSTDRHATYAAIRLRSAGNDKQLAAIRGRLAAPGLRTQVGGPTAIFADVSGRVAGDIGKAEGYSMPILLILLVFVFGSVVAASTPLLVGGLAILGAFVATRLLTYVTDVSVFAMNIITLLGLGMAIDYALFIVSRYREELDRGHEPAVAIERTLATAGRTVAIAALTVSLALASLLLFPQVFLRSMGFGGMAAVLVAMLAALTVLPAMLAVLGTRVNALRVWRRRPAGPRHADGAGWARLARAVMRRPVPVVLATVGVLAVLASPFLRAQFGGTDERVLPPGTESRVVSERIAAQFPSGGVEQVRVLVSGTDAAGAGALAARISRIPAVGRASVVATRDRSAMIAVRYAGTSASPVGQRVVADIRALPAPPGATVLVGGSAAELGDLLDSLRTRLPWMALLVAGVTVLLLFLAFGSVVLPLKAIAMNVVSIGASFGAVVWVFQDGHLAGFLGFTPTGYLEATQLVLMLAIIFGLSTDYEVFLLSRVREEWDRTGDNTAAVSLGLQRTGRIITSAALLLIVVIGGFATGGITFIKMIGVGMIVALLVDATLVRALLVPATMRLLGRANWWAPGVLRRVYARYGLRESDPPAPSDAGTAPSDPAPALQPAR
jgi:RND superfamily putative drug exporter